MAFQDNVKRLRDEKRYTQAELGELVGVAQQVIADYEGGKYRPSIETGVRLANALGTTVEQLLDSGAETIGMNEMEVKSYGE